VERGDMPAPAARGYDLKGESIGSRRHGPQGVRETAAGHDVHLRSVGHRQRLAGATAGRDSAARDRKSSRVGCPLSKAPVQGFMENLIAFFDGKTGKFLVGYSV